MSDMTAATGAAQARAPRRGRAGGPMPAIYLSHGAPPLADDTLWTGQLAGWSAALPRLALAPTVSAHWEAAPLALGATETVPPVYDFWGFPDRYYQVN